ncbi:MAG: type II secretion system F family protein [Candidatus Aenigmatarchaeota archaeon]
MKIEKKYLLLIVLNAFVVLGIVALNFLFLSEIPNIFSTINILACIMFVMPIVLLEYLNYRKLKIIENMFPAFLRDFIELTRGGMNVEQAMKNLRKNDYKELNPYVKKMAIQLDWGIPVERAFVNFAKATKSKMIQRTISSVIESHRFGGNLTDTLEALGNASTEIERIKSERAMYLYSQVTTGYIIFFVFLGVMIAMGRFLIPSLMSFSVEGVTPSAQRDLSGEYKNLFRNLILLQGGFAGLSVGKMAEGRIISGVKHSLIMSIVGLIVFTFLG